jgi:protein TonB
VNRYGVSILLSLLLHALFFCLLSRVPMSNAQISVRQYPHVRLVSYSGQSKAEVPLTREGEVFREEIAKALDEPQKTLKNEKIFQDKTSNGTASPVQKKLLSDPVDGKQENSAETAIISSTAVKQKKEKVSDKKEEEKTLKQTETQDKAKRQDSEMNASNRAAVTETESGDRSHGDGSEGKVRTYGIQGKDDASVTDLPLITDDLIIKKVPPLYPLVSRRKGEEGDVLLRAVLYDSGAVMDVFIEISSGHASLDKTAVEAVKRWTFSPEAPEEVLVPVSFRLR